MNADYARFSELFAVEHGIERGIVAYLGRRGHLGAGGRDLPARQEQVRARPADRARVLRRGAHGHHPAQRRHRGDGGREEAQGLADQQPGERRFGSRVQHHAG